MRKRVRLAAALLGLAVLAGGCAGGPSGGREAETPGPLRFRPGEVKAVVVSWDPALKRTPPPRRTEDPKRFAPLLEVLGEVTEEANPQDLLGPPVHITLELADGSVRRFERWGGYLADRDREVVYGLSDRLWQRVQAALEPLLPPPIPPPRRLSGMITVADLVQALQEHGVEDARDAGEEIHPLLFGARSGRVIQVLGRPVQVYVMESPEAATASETMNPASMTGDGAVPVRLVAVGNLLVTVGVEDQAFAEKIVAYLQMVRE